MFPVLFETTIQTTIQYAIGLQSLQFGGVVVVSSFLAKKSRQNTAKQAFSRRMSLTTRNQLSWLSL